MAAAGWPPQGNVAAAAGAGAPNKSGCAATGAGAEPTRASANGLFEAAGAGAVVVVPVPKPRRSSLAEDGMVWPADPVPNKSTVSLGDVVATLDANGFVSFNLAFWKQK